MQISEGNKYEKRLYILDRRKSEQSSKHKFMRNWELSLLSVVIARTS